MKTILDRFDRSPLWLRLATIFILTGVLVGGLYTVRKKFCRPGHSSEARNQKKQVLFLLRRKTLKKAKEEEEAKIAEAAEKSSCSF